MTTLATTPNARITTFGARAALATLTVAGSIGCTTPAGTPASPAAGSLEEVYVWHSIREPHTSEIAWCSVERTGFAPYPSEAEPNRMFSFWSIEVRSPDGRVVNAKAAKAADGRACFGPTSDPSTIHFYAEGSIGAVTYTGAGDCRVLRADVPEKGIVLLRCTLHLRNLPPPYAGGVLVSNTLSSKAALGADTDPPGYAQSSFATVRLWKAR
jgi:hypothetical protein